MKGSSSDSSSKSAPKCKYFSRANGCRFGDKCRYSHQVEEKPDKDESVEKSGHEDDEAQVVPVNEERNDQSSTHGTEAGETENSNVKDNVPVKEYSKLPGKKTKTFCRYFMKGGRCREGVKCRFLHPIHLLKSRKNSHQEQGGQVNNENTSEPSGGKVDHSKRTITPVKRPTILKPENTAVTERLSELTEQSMKYLQEVEVEQLKKRFGKDDCEITQQDSQITCKLKVKPSDPDWPYDVNEVQLTVRFPSDYPKKIFEAEITDNDTFPENFTKYINLTIGKHLEEHETAQQLRNTADLLLRPFLRWLDRNLESLFTRTLKQIKFEVEAQSAGLEFIPFDTQHSEDGETSAKITETGQDTEEHSEKFVIKNDSLTLEGNVETIESIADTKDRLDPGNVIHKTAEVENTSVMCEMIDSKKVGCTKKGTEVRFRGLELHENTATVQIMSLTFTIQCTRCKNREEMADVRENKQVLLSCSKCSNVLSIVLTSSEVIHQHSSTVAYLIPHGCSPFDLILSECQILLGCLNCSKETSVKGINYGSTKNVWCHHCHQKLDLKVDSAKFHQLQPGATDTNLLTTVVKKNAKNKDPSIRIGQPLPDYGTCKHYKKSFRWMRFPCCGKCYPCDRCHEENEEHEMELANRMICGFCAKEQPFGQKVCISCKSFVTAVHTSHWEGGKGCRNKVKMSRGDSKKYAERSKTVSRHANKVESQKKKK